MKVPPKKEFNVIYDIKKTIVFSANNTTIRKITVDFVT
jgi:hypothetical protein